MDLSLADINDMAGSLNEAELNEIYMAVEVVATNLRKLQNSRIVAIDTYLTFDKGEYSIKIGDLTLRGHHVKYTDTYEKSTRVCRWGEKCRIKENCEYNHSDTSKVIQFGESRLMKRFLNCAPEDLAQFYRLNPEMKNEIQNLKSSILDKIIRLIWLSSSGL